MPQSRSSPKQRPGRPRQHELDDRIESAVLALVRAGGPTAVTMEAVAAEAGVAKTSIYRRHANRGALLTWVMERAMAVPELPPDGSVRHKIRFSLEQAWRQMGQVLGPGGLAAIVTNAEPEFTELFRTALRPYDERLMTRIGEDARAGLLRPDVDAEAIVSLLLGAYLGELIRRGRVDDDWLDRCLDTLWATLRPVPD